MESESLQSLFSPGATKAYGKVFVALLVIALAAALAAVPSEIDSLSATEGDVTWWAPFIAFLVWAVPSAGAVAIGVFLGAKVGLGAPLVSGWIVGEPDMSRRLRSCLLPSGACLRTPHKQVVIPGDACFIPMLARSCVG
jgi:hypothetical protein